MLPARTGSPAKIVTPRRWPALSLPLRVLPCPCLCAIGSADLRHAYRRDRLPVSASSTVVLAPLLLVDEDLPVAALADDLAAHAHALEERRADPHRIVAAGEQHLRELDGGADLSTQALDAQ